MPTAESEETMHLFIDFLAEGGICQTVRVCVRGVSLCVPMHLYMTETHWREAREMWFSPEETQKEHAREEERDNRHIQGNCFLSHSSGVCPSAPATRLRRTWNAPRPQRDKLHRENADKQKWLRWSLNTSRPVVATSIVQKCMSLICCMRYIHYSQYISPAVCTLHSGPLLFFTYASIEMN